MLGIAICGYPFTIQAFPTIHDLRFTIHGLPAIYYSRFTIYHPPVLVSDWHRTKPLTFGIVTTDDSSELCRSLRARQTTG